MLKGFLIIIATACCSFFVPQDSNTERVVMKAAEGQLDAYLGKIQPGHYVEFGFKPSDDLDNCGIAKPYRLMTFTNDFYAHDLEDNKNYTDIKNEWRVPVTVKGEHRVLLTVNGSSGNYKISGMGDAELAKELEIKSAAYNENDAYYLLRVPPLSADFFVSEHENSFSDAEFIPLESAKTAIPSLRLASKASYTLEEIQAMVKTAVKKDPVKKNTASKKHSKK